MNSIRSILLHLDGSHSDARCASVAQALTRQHQARLSAQFAVVPITRQLPAIMDASSSIYPLLEDLHAARKRRARTVFDTLDAAQVSPLPLRWLELGASSLIEGVVRCALTADLLVVGQHNADDPDGSGVPRDFVESVLLASGRPALIVPYAGDVRDVGQEVLLAWKPARESVRALTAALPLMRGARRVHLAAADDVTGQDRTELADYLRLHGVTAPIEQHAAADGDVGNYLLSLVADLNADLLVMGCYGHSRARELVLGGASRTVLASMTVPVLMAH